MSEPCAHERVWELPSSGGLHLLQCRECLAVATLASGKPWSDARWPADCDDTRWMREEMARGLLVALGHRAIRADLVRAGKAPPREEYSPPRREHEFYAQVEADRGSIYDD